MAIERERGISVSSAVMSFEHEGLAFNLLDTPGHQDFSEDTYRTLTAVDSAVMVLDAAAKGTDGASRSRPFEVCRLRPLDLCRRARPRRERRLCCDVRDHNLPYSYGIFLPMMSSKWRDRDGCGLLSDGRRTPGERLQPSGEILLQICCRSSKAQ